MTLVELLVVVAIIGLLAVTVLPNVASTTENRRSREAARVTSTFIAKAQSRAIGRTEWAGVTVVPTNANVLYAIDLFQANVPQVYRGESYESKATLTIPASSILQDQPKRAIYFSDVPLRNWRFGDARSVLDGDLIRFAGRDPWYELTSLVEDTTRDIGAPAIMMRGDTYNSAGAPILVSSQSAGYSTTNSAWPTLDVGHQFEIIRRPVRNGSAFTIPDGRCVDLAWSGHGGSSYTPFLVPGTPVTVPTVTVLFDATGRVRQIFTQNGTGANRITITGPIYFLVGRVDRANNDPTLASTYDPKDDSTGFNWQYGDSYWIVIDPASGIVKTAECLPVKTYANVTAGLLLSQQFARSETPTGGK
jgi:type II secretory pathway pseudopilin PulG